MAHAPALPQYADGSATRVVQQLASVDAMWEAGVQGRRRRLREARRWSRRLGGECQGEPPPTWAGVYCDATRELSIDHVSHLRRHNATGGGLADLVLGYIVAHEVGHHVQYRPRCAERDTLGHPDPARAARRVPRRRVGQGRRPAAPARVVLRRTMPTHGTALQQSQWLNEGYRHGRPADCNAVWEIPL